MAKKRAGKPWRDLIDVDPPSDRENPETPVMISRLTGQVVMTREEWEKERKKSSQRLCRDLSHPHHRYSYCKKGLFKSPFLFY